MIYRSNLTCPDLRPYFKLLDPPKTIQGHDAPSDPDFDPNCCWWTHDEAAILWHVARQVRGNWLDLGARCGWTMAHLLEKNCRVLGVDREYIDRDCNLDPRARENLYACDSAADRPRLWSLFAGSVENYFRIADKTYDGFVIDADHDEPQPLLDAQGCHRIAKSDAVILMHDFWGRPIQDGVKWLMENGWRCRIYNTPNGVALLWRGFEDFGIVAPEHIPDPAINWGEIRSRVSDFPWDKTE